MLALAGMAGIYYAWWLEIEYRFRVIEKDAVFQSGAMPPQVLARYVNSHHIRTVLDLRDQKVAGVEAEREALDKSPAEHVWVPMPPDPSDEQIRAAMDVLLDPSAHPVLVHCHHGEGRSVMMAALYRMLAMEASFDEALRQTARLPPGLLPLMDLLPTGFAEGDYKAETIRLYAERYGPRH